MTIGDIQSICSNFKAVTEDIKWQHNLVFSVAAKMFCIAGIDEDPTTASFKVAEEEFDEMSTRHGFRPAPYLAKNKWVFIEDINLMKRSEWEKYLKRSYELVKAKLPAKIRKQIEE